MKNKYQSYIYNQYRGTNIEDLLTGVKNIKENNILRLINTIKNNVFDLSKAEGIFLDKWGQILNFSRNIPLGLSTNAIYKEINFLNNFNSAIFKEEKLLFYRLEDNLYRKILLFKLRAKNINTNQDDLTKLASEIFDSKIVVGDSLNMEYVYYYFFEDIAKPLQYVLNIFDILPRPAGVGSKIFFGIYKYLNFETKDRDYNLSKITNFYNAVFAPDALNEIQEKIQNVSHEKQAKIAPEKNNETQEIVKDLKWFENEINNVYLKMQELLQKQAENENAQQELKNKNMNVDFEDRQGDADIEQMQKLLKERENIDNELQKYQEQYMALMVEGRDLGLIELH